MRQICAVPRVSSVMGTLSCLTFRRKDNRAIPLRPQSKSQSLTLLPSPSQPLSSALIVGTHSLRSPIEHPPCHPAFVPHFQCINASRVLTH